MNILETIAATVQYRNAMRALPPYAASDDGRTLHCGGVSTAMLPDGWEAKTPQELIPCIETAFVKVTAKALHQAHNAVRKAPAPATEAAA